MNISRSIQGTLVYLCLMVLANLNQGAIVSIKQHGAKGDNHHDDGPAIMSAWKEACASRIPSTLVIPAGTYMAYPPVLLEGPCNAPITIQAQGASLKAPADLLRFKADAWITLQHIDRLTLLGGTFDGQGHIAWAKNDCAKTGKCTLPMNIRFNFVTNSLISGVTSLNSKFFHMDLLGCDNTNLERITIGAPEESINTDGIHIGRSNGVNITDAHIRTGDDCISLGDGSKNINIEKVTCGPGHGISIGSLGKYKGEEPVEGIWIKNCTFTDTMNGVRIKTWPGSPDGIARNLHFDNIIMNNVGNPVLIDQEYCPYAQCKAELPSRVKISDVSFRSIRGTSSTKSAVRLICSRGLGCDRVVVSDINLAYHGTEGGDAVSECANVKPLRSGKLVPPACTVPH